jgi:hypothetical protein
MGNDRGRLVPVVALTETGADAAVRLAAELASALARTRRAPVDLLAVPGTATPPPPRGVRLKVGGLSAVLDRRGDTSLVVAGLPPRDLPRLRVICPDTVAALLVPPSLPAAHAAVRLLDQSPAWGRRTVLVPLRQPPAMARAVLHVAAAAAAGVVPLPGIRRGQLRRAAGLLAAVSDLPAPAWPGQRTPALEEEHLPCIA